MNPKKTYFPGLRKIIKPKKLKNNMTRMCGTYKIIYVCTNNKNTS